MTTFAFPHVSYLLYDGNQKNLDDLQLISNEIYGSTVRTDEVENGHFYLYFFYRELSKENLSIQPVSAA